MIYVRRIAYSETPWFWRCGTCGVLGVGHYSQQGAIREAFRHCKENRA